MKQYHARRTEHGQKQNLAEVVFEIGLYDIDRKYVTSGNVHIHWMEALKYLRATGARVVGVTFFGEFGRVNGPVSFASWKRNGYTDLYRIEVGASGVTYLEEHEGPHCPCAYEPPRPQHCAIHPSVKSAPNCARHECKRDASELDKCLASGCVCKHCGAGFVYDPNE